MKKVKMNKCRVIPFDAQASSNEALLCTYGVTTCIAIIFQGSFHDIPYIGLYHWSGFNNKRNSQEEALNDIFETLSLELQSEYYSDCDEKHSLSGIYIIGGERQQLGQDGSLQISGTEAEVTALQKNILHLCQTYFNIEDKLDLCFQNFITHGSESLSIKAFPNRVEYQTESSSFLERSPRSRSVSSINFGDNLIKLDSILERSPQSPSVSTVNFGGHLIKAQAEFDIYESCNSLKK